MLSNTNMTAVTKSFPEIPDCDYQNDPVLITPDRPTPKHTLYLSNLDNQQFLRFTVECVYLFEKAVPVEKLKVSLSKTLTSYYPLAGRLRAIGTNNNENINCRKLEVDCNGEGALFVEAYIDYSANQFVEFLSRPNKSSSKLLGHRVRSPTFLDAPLLVVQVTKLKCGGMIICTSIHHCMCDGAGTSQFWDAWSKNTAYPDFVSLVTPCHNRRLFSPRSPLKVTFTHPEFTTSSSELPWKDHFNIINYLRTQPLVTNSISFTHSQILTLKKKMMPSVNCTTYEALASHTWKSWTKALNLSHSLKVKLLFSVNIRKKVKPEIPQGYYGNGFVLACAETTVKELTTLNLSHSVKLVQHAKSSLNDDYVRSMIDLLEDRKIVTDLSTTFVITQFKNMDHEHKNFGSGEPLYMGALQRGVYCFFLPIMGEPDSTRVSVNLPHNIAEKFIFYMTKNMNKGDVQRATRRINERRGDSKL